MMRPFTEDSARFSQMTDYACVSRIFNGSRRTCAPQPDRGAAPDFSATAAFMVAAARSFGASPENRAMLRSIEVSCNSHTKRPLDSRAFRRSKPARSVPEIEGAL